MKVGIAVKILGLTEKAPNKSEREVILNSPAHEGFFSPLWPVSPEKIWERPDGVEVVGRFYNSTKYWITPSYAVVLSDEGVILTYSEITILESASVGPGGYLTLACPIKLEPAVLPKTGKPLEITYLGFDRQGLDKPPF